MIVLVSLWSWLSRMLKESGTTGNKNFHWEMSKFLLFFNGMLKIFWWLVNIWIFLKPVKNKLSILVLVKYKNIWIIISVDKILLIPFKRPMIGPMSNCCSWSIRKVIWWRCCSHWRDIIFWDLVICLCIFWMLQSRSSRRRRWERVIVVRNNFQFKNYRICSS